MFRLKKSTILISLIFTVEFMALGRAYFKGYGRMTTGCAAWILLTASFFLLAYGYRKGLHMQLDTVSRNQRILLTAIVLLCTLICTIPMGASPYWNGEIPGHRNQYEVMTEALLNGQLHLDYDVDPRLMALENPYDPQLRTDAGVDFHWDHALYNGRYYMYFGIVPVFMAFLPYRLITGQVLTTYHATQLFTALTIITLFALLLLLARLFFKRMPFSYFVSLAVSFSLMSVWYSVSYPAMYCTAISAAILLILLSTYLFIHAVWAEHTENKRIAFAFGGALCGALAFGCRPPIALANILVIPMLVVYLRKFPLTFKRFGKLILAASPYFVVALLLMLYNNARFDSPFEFGQTYQLTRADQTQYNNLAVIFDTGRIARFFLSNFFGPRTRSTFGGAFVNFPVLFFAFGIFHPQIRIRLKIHQLLGLAYVLFAIPVIITFVDIAWSPVLLERYRMDIYFLMCLLCFIVIGTQHAIHSDHSVALDIAVFAFSLFTIITCAWFFCIPYDANWASVFYPDILQKIINTMSLGFYR